VTPLDIDREIGKRFGFACRTDWIVTDGVDCRTRPAEGSG